MKNLLLVGLCVVCNAALGVQVDATGMGGSVAEALENAKTAAVERVAGTFVVGRAQTDGEHYSAMATQYNAGLIKHYQLLQTSRHGALYQVAIRADVATSAPALAVQSSGATITPDTSAALHNAQTKGEQAREAIAALDTPLEAFRIVVDSIKYVPAGPTVTVRIAGHVRLDERWLEDVKRLAELVGGSVDALDGSGDGVWGLAALSAVVNPALPGMLFSAAREVQVTSPVEARYVTCFGQTNGWVPGDCYDLRYPMVKTAGSRALNLNIDLVGDGRVKQTARKTLVVAPELFIQAQRGQKVYFRQSAREHRFEHEGVVFFGKGQQHFDILLDLSIADIEPYSRFEIRVGESAKNYFR